MTNVQKKKPHSPLVMMNETDNKETTTTIPLETGKPLFTYDIPLDVTPSHNQNHFFSLYIHPFNNKCLQDLVPILFVHDLVLVYSKALNILYTLYPYHSNKQI